MKEMRDLMEALAHSICDDEASANSLMEMAQRLEDRGADAEPIRTLVRMHRAKIIENQAHLDALAVEYIRRADAGLA